MATTFTWILAGGLLMSAIALVGSVTLVLREVTLKRLLLPLVALAAGTLLGGALFHMIPAAVEALGNRLSIYSGEVSWRIFEEEAPKYEAWYATLRGQRVHRAERALLEWLLAAFPQARSVLEIGCGTGHFTRWFAEKLPLEEALYV